MEPVRRHPSKFERIYRLNCSQERRRRRKHLQIENKKLVTKSLIKTVIMKKWTLLKRVCIKTVMTLRNTHDFSIFHVCLDNSDEDFAHVSTNKVAAGDPLHKNGLLQWDHKVCYFLNSKSEICFSFTFIHRSGKFSLLSVMYKNIKIRVSIYGLS